MNVFDSKIVLVDFVFCKLLLFLLKIWLIVFWLFIEENKKLLFIFDNFFEEVCIELLSLLLTKVIILDELFLEIEFFEEFFKEVLNKLVFELDDEGFSSPKFSLIFNFEPCLFLNIVLPVFSVAIVLKLSLLLWKLLWERFKIEGL